MKRSEIKRKTPLRPAASITKTPKPPKGPKAYKCKNPDCRGPYFKDPKQPWVEWCSVECGTALALLKLANQKAKEKRQDRAETKAKLAVHETIPQLKARLQTVFNTFIRMRDDAYPCICCGKWPKGDGALHGGQWDACHWKGRGAHDHLRYNEDNVHKGLKDCNKYGHTDYRGGLIKRIGLERVLALESEHAVVKWDRDWLRERISHYQRRVRELKKELQNV